MYKITEINDINELSTLIDENKLEYHIFTEDCYRDVYIITRDGIKVAIIEIVEIKYNFIQWFEVFLSYRKKGYGSEIISFILDQFRGATVGAVPNNEYITAILIKNGFVRSQNNSSQYIHY